MDLLYILHPRLFENKSKHVGFKSREHIIIFGLLNDLKLKSCQLQNLRSRRALYYLHPRSNEKL